MAISETSIANLALSKIGALRITNIDTDTSISAQHCRAQYDITRDQLLRSHAWAFAVGRKSISADATTPDFEWDYQYSVPADCIRVLGIYGTDYPYALEGEKLLTDASEIDLKYIKGITDPTKFDSLFVEVLVLQLAVNLAIPLSQDVNLAERAAGELMVKMKQARRISFTETDSGKELPVTWNESRRGGARAD